MEMGNVSKRQQPDHRADIHDFNFTTILEGQDFIQCVHVVKFKFVFT